MRCEGIDILDKKIGTVKKLVLLASINRELLEALCERIDEYNLENIEIWHSIDGIADKRALKHISNRSMDDILNVYHTYDFSNKIVVIDDSNQYGNLLFYTYNEIITYKDWSDILIDE